MNFLINQLSRAIKGQQPPSYTQSSQQNDSKPEGTIPSSHGVKEEASNAAGKERLRDRKWERTHLGTEGEQALFLDEYMLANDPTK